MEELLISFNSRSIDWMTEFSSLVVPFVSFWLILAVWLENPITKLITFYTLYFNLLVPSICPLFSNPNLPLSFLDICFFSLVYGMSTFHSTLVLKTTNYDLCWGIMLYEICEGTRSVWEKLSELIIWPSVVGHVKIVDYYT